MSIFASNPIKINIIKNDEVVKIIVFTGSVPSDVENALKKVEKGAKIPEAPLKNFMERDGKLN